MQEIDSLNPAVVARIYDSNNSWAGHHRSLKLGSKSKYFNRNKLKYLEPESPLDRKILFVTIFLFTIITEFIFFFGM